MKFKKNKKKKKKKKGKKKAAAPPKEVPKEPAKDVTFTSASSSFKKGKATYTNPTASPSKSSQATESPKKAELPSIPENIPPGTFGINIESTGFTEKTEVAEKEDKEDKVDEGEDAEEDNEIKMEFS